MGKLICDTFYQDTLSKECTNHSRLVEGISMRIIETYGHQNISHLNNTTAYTVLNLTCCSAVKNTERDWHYVVPESIVSVLSKWLEELRPVFPTLDMEIYEIQNKYITEDTTVLNINFVENKGPANTSFGVYLKLGRQSNTYYGYTNSKTASHAYFRQMSFISRDFLRYCSGVEPDLNKDNVERLARLYIRQEENHIRTLFKEPRTVTVTIYDPSKPIDIRDIHGPYAVESSKIIDADGTDLDSLVKYLVNSYSANVDLCKRVISYYSDKTNKETSTILRVRYSRKRYSVESYLAHILLRAAFTENTQQFITQYFKIKEKYPELYFWNLIFLTQMGFNFYYYYWLTDRRFFRFTDEEDFMNRAKAYSGVSSQEFINNSFVQRLSLSASKKLLCYYKEGQLDTIIESLNYPLKVRPTKVFKSCNDNFLISDCYEVIAYDKDTYFIIGDDYRIRKYKKENFEIVESCLIP